METVSYEYALGAHAAVAVGGDYVALLSRTTRGWAVLSRHDYEVLQSCFVAGPIRSDAVSTAASDRLEELHFQGLVTRDGAHHTLAMPQARDAPEALLIKMTGQCNFNCRYCYDYAPDRVDRVLAPERAIEAIETLVARTGKLTVTFHGGEPLLAFDGIRRIVTRCEGLRRAGAVIRYALQTNGVLLDGQKIEFLDQYNFSVGVSIDGIWPETDRMRGGGRSTATSVLTRLLGTHGDFVRRRCGILAVLYRESIARMPEFALWLQDHGIGGLSTTVLDPAGRAGSLAGEQVSAAEVVTLYGRWLEAIDNGDISSLAISNLIAYMDNLCTFDPPSFCQKGPCGAAGDFLVVDADGSFRACDCVIHDYFVLGGPNVAASSILGAEPRQKLLARHQRMVAAEPCAHCPWLRLCGCTCVAKALGRSGGVEDVYAPECAVSRFLYPRLFARFAEDPDGPIFRYQAAHTRLRSRDRRGCD